MRGIVVLGCTGSIGDTTFGVLEELKDRYRIVGLAGGLRVEKLIARARTWEPQLVCVAQEADRKQVQAALPAARVVAGREGLGELVAHDDVDLVVNALVGGVGLTPTVQALRSGRAVAMANKEPLVMAGDLILAAAAAGHAALLPLDSEPNAIWQCLRGERKEDIRRLILTASGGPFFGRRRHELAGIHPREALAHPTWRMGKKITVDSATMMNKGFEVIEASLLFGVELDRVEVVIHRESVVHSMVEFQDGSILAHMGRTDMALPIHYALTYPQRMSASGEPLDLAALGRLSFAAPDRATFPCLDLCYGAARQGGGALAALNAADELAVAAFLQEGIGFLDIERVNESVVAQAPRDIPNSVEEVLAVDSWARRRAAEEIHKRG